MGIGEVDSILCVRIECIVVEGVIIGICEPDSCDAIGICFAVHYIIISGIGENDSKVTVVRESVVCDVVVIAVSLDKDSIECVRVDCVVCDSVVCGIEEVDSIFVGICGCISYFAIAYIIVIDSSIPVP